MAANMPQMVANGQMMLLQQQQQQAQQQQGQNEKQLNQLNQYLYNSIVQHMATLPGNSWHGNASNIADRYTKAFSLYDPAPGSSLALAISRPSARMRWVAQS